MSEDSTPQTPQSVDAETLAYERLPRIMVAALWMGLILCGGSLVILEFDPPATVTFVAGMFAWVALVEPGIERVKTW